MLAFIVSSGNVILMIVALYSSQLDQANLFLVKTKKTQLFGIRHNEPPLQVLPLSRSICTPFCSVGSANGSISEALEISAPTIFSQ